MFFKHSASKNQLPGFYISRTLVENRLISYLPDIRSEIDRLDDLLNSTSLGLSLPHEETKAIGNKCCMLLTLTKRWYLRCYKYRHRNLNLYLNIYPCESSFLFRGNSMIEFNDKKPPNKQSKTYFDETNEKSENYCK